MGEMMVEVSGFGGIRLGEKMGLIDGGDALCEGRERKKVSVGFEGFAVDGARKGLVAGIWGVIKRVEIGGLVESEDDGGLV
jgi:hypothetical protein